MLNKDPTISLLVLYTISIIFTPSSTAPNPYKSLLFYHTLTTTYNSLSLSLSAMGLLHLALILSSLVIVLGTAPGHHTNTIAQPPTALAPAPAPHHHKGGGHHHHHKHAPTPAPAPAPAHSPVKPPTQAPAPTPVKPPVKPVKPPVQAPVKAPSHAPTPLPARKLVSVQGVVYCKPCNYTGVETLLGATPLLGKLHINTQLNTIRLTSDFRILKIFHILYCRCCGEATM